MRILVASAIFVLLNTSAHADSFYKLIVYECDKTSNTIIISYRGAYNTAGEIMMK